MPLRLPIKEVDPLLSRSDKVESSSVKLSLVSV